LYSLVEEGYKYIGVGGTKIHQATYKEIEKKDCETLFILHQNVDATNFERIVQAKTSKEV